MLNVNPVSLSEYVQIPSKTPWRAASSVLMSMLLVAGLLLAGCDSSDPGEPSESPVTIAFLGETATESTASTHAFAAPPQTTITDPSGDSLMLDQVEVLIDEVEFEAADQPDDDAGDRERGPFLIDLPIDADEPEVQIESALPPGSWDEIALSIESADDEADLPDDFPEETSIRVTGEWNPADGDPEAFTFTSDLDAEREIEFDPPITVTSNTSKNITIAVHLDGWFRDENDAIVDPNDDANEDLIEDNIEQSFEGFEDDDMDGDDDADDDDDDDDDGDDD